jgi:hypothetical protein
MPNGEDRTTLYKNKISGQTLYVKYTVFKVQFSVLIKFARKFMGSYHGIRCVYSRTDVKYAVVNCTYIPTCIARCCTLPELLLRLLA